jgi:branched-chain amino acid transport system substrate-binding protein
VLVERLIREDGVRFILGPYSALLTKAAVPVVEKHRIPMVEANGASRDVFSRGYEYLFAVLSTSDNYLTQAIDLAVAYAAKFGKAPNELTLAMATDDGPLAQDARAGVLASVKEHGVNLVVDDRLPPELDDMSMTLSKVEELKPDMLVVSGHDKGALTAVEQLGALQVSVPMIAMTHCDSAQVERKFLKASSYIFCVQQWHRSLNYKGHCSARRKTSRAPLKWSTAMHRHTRRPSPPPRSMCSPTR